MRIPILGHGKKRFAPGRLDQQRADKRRHDRERQAAQDKARFLVMESKFYSYGFITGLWDIRSKITADQKAESFWIRFKKPVDIRKFFSNLDNMLLSLGYEELE